MDPQRFDSLAKRLGTRLSRRSALLAGAGVALGSVAISNLPPANAQDPETTAKDRFVSIRSYPYSGPIDIARAGLKGLIPVMYEQPGFLSIQFVQGDGEIHLVSVYLDETSALAGLDQMDTWIAERAQAILRGEPGRISGPVFLRSELNTGCPCQTGDEDACNSDRLVCCGTTDAEDGPGVCLTPVTTCPGSQTEETDDETDSGNGATPSATSTATASGDTSCSGAGCACIIGVDGTCDGGLQCCGSGEVGAVGVCASDCSGVCTGVGCGCIAGADGGCDAGLQCCSTGGPGSIGACFSDCGGGGCTADGCACDAGVEGACDDGLECCGAEPGALGICQVSCESVGICPGGNGCSCTEGVDGECNGGLVCCGAGEPGGPGFCQIACA